MGSVSELSSALSSLLLSLLSLMLLLLLILLKLLLLLLVSETEVVLLSARAGWRGARRRRRRAGKASRSILRGLSSADLSLLCRFKSSLLNLSSQAKAGQVSDTGVRGGGRMTGGGPVSQTGG